LGKVIFPAIFVQAFLGKHGPEPSQIKASLQKGFLVEGV